MKGRFGVSPIISIPKSAPTGKFVVVPQNQGHGHAARTGDAVIVKYAAVAWRSGKALPDSYDKGAHPKVISVGRNSVLAALDQAVQGQCAGSRILVVAPPATAYGSTGSKRLGVSGKDTIVFVVDVMKVVAADALVPGAQATVPEGLPRVQMNRANGTAAISVPDRDAPKTLVTKRLVNGAGAILKTGQTAVLQYSTTAWQPTQGKKRADLFMSSHADGGPLAAVMGHGNVLKGWERALAGQRVGSRILAVMPADLAYGTHPPRDLQSGATVVTVLDILAAS